MAFLDQYSDQPNPPSQGAAASQDKGGNYLDQYKDVPPSSNAPQPSLLQSAGKGVIGALGSPVPMTGFEPPEWMETIGKANEEGYFKKTPEEREADLNKAFPNADNSLTGKMVEKGIQGGIYGALTGPQGIIPGVLSGAASEAHEHFRPDHPIENIGVGLATGIGGSKIAGKAAEFGVKTGRSILERFGLMESPVNDLYRDIGSAGLQGGPRVSGANDSTRFWQQIQNAQREGIGGGERIAANEQELFHNVEERAHELARGLGPDLTHQELGEFIQGHAVSRAEQIKDEISSLYTALNSIVPKSATVAPNNFTTALQDISARYAGAPNIGSVASDPYIQRLLQATQQDLFRSPNGTLPYGVLDSLRKDIGEQVEKGAINPNIDIKQMRLLYSALSRDLETAYSANGLRAFRTVQAATEKQFDDLGHLQGITKVGLEPETITTRLLAQANKGSTRIDDITSQLNNVDPDTRNTVMGYVLRRLGETPDKSFNPATFYRNWEKLSPEAKALYPPAQREGIDRLGQITGLIANSFESANTSHTSGNLATLERIGQAVRGLLGAGTGMAAGIGAGHIAGLEHEVYPMAMFGSAIGAAAGESVINNMIARLLTNKTFNIWLATDAPNLTPDKLPAALGALAAQAPAIGTEVGVLKNTIEKQLGYVPQGTPGDIKREGGGYAALPQQQTSGYALGGLTNTPDPDTLKTEKAGKHKDTSQEDYATLMHNHQADPNISRQMMLMMQSQGYAQGGPLRLMGGGSVHSPFGIGLDGDGMIGYAEGGKVEANENEPPGSLLDQFMGTNVIPFKTGAAGKYGDSHDFLGYHMGNANDPESGGTVGFMSKITPKSVLNFDPYKSDIFWGNDMPAMTGEPANSNSPFEPLPRPQQYAQGGIAKDKNDPRPFYNPQLPGVGTYAEGGRVSGSEIGEYANGGPTGDDDDKMLNQIAYRESNNRNVMNYINDPKHTAGGLYQITNSTWRDFAPSSILSHWSRAIDAPPEVQREVAKLILKSPGGIHRWMDYNPKLRADIQGGHFNVDLKGSPQGSPQDSLNVANSSATDAQEQTQAETPQEQQSERPSSILEAVLADNPSAQNLVKTIWET